VAFGELKARLATAWSAADWQVVAEWMRPMHERLVGALDPQPGERWLDVATGTGATALLAASAGADVTAQDLAPGMIDRARGLAEEQGLRIRFDVGDAEALPYDDGSFDIVGSAVGMILTPNHRAMAAQLARVCASGGRLGFTAWRPGVEYFTLVKRFQPPPEPGADDREDWGREKYVEQLLGSAFDLSFEDGDSPFVGSSGRELWERMLAGVGTLRTLYESFEPARQRELEEALVDYFESNRVGGEIRAPAPYLLVRGRRR
jgi:ubiquinone/menaquinone biosynthesis C-methylase UbiE